MYLIINTRPEIRSFSFLFQLLREKYKNEKASKTRLLYICER
jgi:hypothetical protein